MSDDAAFLREIRANPRHSSRRLVYADWLEERADPRGELVRIEEEMRQIPAFGDRFWDLKPRRDELRALGPPDWLEAMRYGTACHPAFRHGWPDGVKERWRLIREFVERWRRIPLGDVGGRVDEAREVESRLGRPLSPSIREWVAFAHDSGERFGPSLIVIHDVYTMQILGNHPAVSLLCMCEGDYEWAVRIEDLGRADPPVYSFIGDPLALEGSEGEPTADRLTSFALAYAVACTRGEGGEFSTIIDDPARLTRDLETWFPGRCRVGGTVLFDRIGVMELREAEDILVELGRNRYGHYITVQFARPLPDEAIPPFFWDLARNSNSVRGPFGRGKNLPGFWDPSGNPPA